MRNSWAGQATCEWLDVFCDKILDWHDQVEWERSGVRDSSLSNCRDEALETVAVRVQQTGNIVSATSQGAQVESDECVNTFGVSAKLGRVWVG